MQLRRLSAVVCTLALAITGVALSSVSTMAGLVAPKTLTIGVDNAGPAGHNFEYLDYYPRAGVSVHNGDILDFKSNAASLDGFHTATLGACRNLAGAPAECTAGQSTETAAQIKANYPDTVADVDLGSTVGDAPGQRLFNNKIQFPTNPPPVVPVVGCGNAAKPCLFNGSQDLNSGAMTGPGTPFPSDYFYKISLLTAPASPITVHYVCVVHGPVMSGSFTIVPNVTASSTQALLDTAAATQFAPQTPDGLAAEAAANISSVTTNANGTHTVKVTAGTQNADGHVSVLEMLPTNVTVTAGDTVRWTSNVFEIHTVTFPTGAGSDAIDPLRNFCENPVTGDGAPGNGPGPPCPAFPTDFETHFNPQPQGTTVISTPMTAGTSGLIFRAGSPAPFPASYSFSFPNTGTFAYQCRVHNHMTGQVLAAAVVAPILPKAGTRASAPVKGDGILAVIAILGLIALVAVARLASRQER